MSISLNEIFIKNATGKSSEVHDYAVKYEKFFAPYRDKEISILEIGVAGGQSLISWEEYFPKAKITGIDINSACYRGTTDRVKVFIGDQGNNAFLTEVAKERGGFDIIIDDGSHYIEHMISSFECLWPYVKEDGLYVIEDIHTNYGSGRNPGTRTIFDWLHQMNEAIHFNGHYLNGIWLGNKGKHLKTLGDMPVTEIEKTLDSITVYNSIVFLEKKDLYKMKKSILETLGVKCEHHIVVKKELRIAIGDIEIFSNRKHSHKKKARHRNK